MKLPPRLFAPKTSQEFVLLASLYHIADENGEVQVTMDELSKLTRMRREPQRRALRRLEADGLVETTRTVLGAGRLSTNRYRLLLQDAAK
jgi:predicted ArsR family transcriptional regulator